MRRKQKFERRSSAARLHLPSPRSDGEPIKKLALDLENLRVESFSTSPESAPRRGTVRGNGFSDFDCTTFTIEPKLETLNVSCIETDDCNDTRSQYWSCVCTPSGQYTCAC